MLMLRIRVLCCGDGGAACERDQRGSSDSLVLYDPMCGSGTILAEAALMATQTPAAFLREKWYCTLTLSAHR
jgi:23S rRNA G2445 N2-methylase RlmL